MVVSAEQDSASPSNAESAIQFKAGQIDFDAAGRVGRRAHVVYEVEIGLSRRSGATITARSGIPSEFGERALLEMVH